MNDEPGDQRVTIDVLATRATGAAADDKTKKKLGVIELFAGIGCVAQGFERTGRFETILLSDVDQDARDAYVENFPEAHGARYLRRDVESVYPKLIRDVAAGRQIVGILGCPPCQGFSSAGL